MTSSIRQALRRVIGAVLLLVGLLVASAPYVRAVDRAREAAGPGFSRAEWATIGGIKPSVFDLALGAASCAVQAGAAIAPATLTVIDYSLPSTARRMWVYDLSARRLLFEELVAHGSGSGDNFARAFSNTPESHQSSLGLFVTDQPYVGKNGYSLRLEGLDLGFNDRARDRAIVIHGAPYVSEVFARAQGRIGRSWGCPAVRDGIARELIDRVRGGGLVFAYYPDPRWLAQSRFVQCAAAAASTAP